MKLGSYILGLLSLASLLASCGKRDLPPYVAPPGISWSSVLTRTADTAMIAAPIHPWERSVHFSSSATTGKVMLANLAPEILGDMDHGFFLDVAENPSGIDATLAEVRGKGMITWMWSANPAGTIRLFIDDESAPALEMPFKDFLNGAFLPVASPFAAPTANGYNLHFPILHDRYCKVVLRTESKKDLASLFYQVAWNAVDPSKEVARFTVADCAAGTGLLRQFRDLQQNPFAGHLNIDSRSADIASGQVFDMYSSQQAGTITRVDLHTGTKAELANIQLLAYWDNSTSPSIDCPLYMLAGASARMVNLQAQPIHVKGSFVSIGWPMPFNAARLSVKNTSDQAIRLDYAINLVPDATGMRFGGQHREHNGLRTDARNVITLANTRGPGRIVGCNIQVKSRTRKWWGEGDQLIYLDSAVTPTWQGTGTEDYYGFAWCSRSTFDHPYRGQSAVWDNDTETTSAMYRHHLLDQVPFQNTASFQSEAWGLTDGFLDYESLVLYYTKKEAQQSGGAYFAPAAGLPSGQP